MFKPLQEVWINVGIKKIDIYKEKTVKTLLDNRAIELFIS